MTPSRARRSHSATCSSRNHGLARPESRAVHFGSYEGGKILFLGLGTGLGSALVVDGIVEPMELGHLPFRKATFENYVGELGRKRLGKKKWEQAVAETIERLTSALEPDYVVVGGGNAKKLGDPPASVRLGANDNAFLGAFRLWDDPEDQRVL